MSSPLPAVVLDDLSFTWPDGSTVLRGLTGTFGRGRTGLIGRNGAGKSTLLRLIAGQLRPSAGTISVPSSVAYLPQNLTLALDATLADLLGVRGQLDALRAIEGGDPSPAWFDVLADAWDVEERSMAALAEAGLPTELDRRVATLSGGETVLAALTGIRLRGASVALLDEPTNNLDGESRRRLYALIEAWRGTLVTVSHDLELLDLMDATAELRDRELVVFGGPYHEYAAALEREQAAARQALRTAEQTLRTQRRQRIEAEQKLAHAERQGRKDKANARYAPIVWNGRGNAAEKSAGARRGMLDARVAAAQSAVAEAAGRVRDDDRIRLDLPDPGVPAGRRIAELVGRDGRALVLQGPQRVALTGANGVGKTTLIAQLVTRPGGGPQRPSAIAFTDRIGYLPQRLDGLADARDVLANVRDGAPTVPEAVLRNRLARLGLRGHLLARSAGSLSGGERFRVALARVLLAEPPAQLLVLDEPTNNLDLASVEQLVAGLAAYRGALLVVSHDRRFLGQLGLDVEVVLEADGRLRVAADSGLVG